MLKPEADIRELTPGKYYAVIEIGKKEEGYEGSKIWGIRLFQFDHSDTDSESHGKVAMVRAYPRIDELFGYRYGTRVSGGVWLDINKEDAAVTAVEFDKKTGERVTRDWGNETYMYEITREDIKKLLTIKEPDYDPLIGTECTREAYCVYVALKGLQYTKWGKYERQGRFSTDPAVNRQNYGIALDEIIDRFGLETFASEVKDIFKNHLNSLHTVLHLTKSPYKPHSDITPLDADEMRLARQVIRDSHPLTPDMTESGHVVNAVSLFGDSDFWWQMKSKYPLLFNRFTDYLETLPRQMETHGTYANAVIDPIGVIKKYYPDAYESIHEVRNDFDSDTDEPIRVTEKNNIP